MIDKKKKATNYIIIAICTALFVVIILIIGANYYGELSCDEGTLIDDVCYTCPDGYTINKDSKECELITNTTTKQVKTNEEIIQTYKEECQTYNYKDIFRYAEDYKGKYVKFTGEVIQVMEDTYGVIKMYTLRVNVTKTDYGYEDTVYVRYFPMENAPRILEEDIITIYGELEGLETYTSIMGSSVTIPSITSNYVEIE